MIEQAVVSLTSDAQSRLKELLVKEGNPQLALRIFVSGGGCSGMSYGMAFVVASIPFFVFTPLGMAIAWMLGVTTVGPPIFALTILWSMLYIWALGPKRAFQDRRSIVHAASPEFTRIAAWSLLSGGSM